MSDCIWPHCGGALKQDGLDDEPRCYKCARTGDKEYEERIADKVNKFDNHQLRIEAKIREAHHGYGRLKDVTDEMWRTLKTGQVALRMGCSTSWASHLKPKKYKQKYIRRNDKHGLS